MWNDRIVEYLIFIQDTVLKCQKKNICYDCAVTYDRDFLYIQDTIVKHSYLI